MRILNTIEEWEDPSDLFTPEEQEEQCCHAVSVDICADVGKKEPYTSSEYPKSEDLDALVAEYQARVQTGIRVVGYEVVESNSSPAGDCGEMITEWKADKDCCEEVEELAINEEETDEYLPSTQDIAGYITVTGGKLPLTVHVKGGGFYIAPDLRNALVWGRRIAVRTLEACGAGTFEISDGCSEIVATVKSVDGYWKLTDTWVGECKWSFKGTPIYSKGLGFFVLEEDNYRAIGGTKGFGGVCGGGCYPNTHCQTVIPYDQFNGCCWDWTGYCYKPPYPVNSCTNGSLTSVKQCFSSVVYTNTEENPYIWSGQLYLPEYSCESGDARAFSGTLQYTELSDWTIYEWVCGE